MRAFTLVELLVVVSILLLVAVIALPAVTSLSKSAARRSAVSQAMGILDQARSIALTQNHPVYVVFADGNTNIPEAYRFRSYALYREVYYPSRRNGTGDGKLPHPYEMELLRPWTRLPEGVAFRPPAAESPERTLFVGPRDEFLCEFATPDGQRVRHNLELPYLRFTALGVLEQKDREPWPANLAQLRIFEGFVDLTGRAISSNRPPQGEEKFATTGDDVLVVSTVTGRARREENDAG